MATELDAARLLTLRAATLKDRGIRHSKEAAMAKLFASEVANRAAKGACRSSAAMATSRTFQPSATIAMPRSPDLRRHERDPRLVIAGAILKE